MIGDGSIQQSTSKQTKQTSEGKREDNACLPSCLQHVIKRAEPTLHGGSINVCRFPKRRAAVLFCLSCVHDEMIATSERLCVLWLYETAKYSQCKSGFFSFLFLTTLMVLAVNQGQDVFTWTSKAIDVEGIWAGIKAHSRDCCQQRQYWSGMALHYISNRTALAKAHNQAQMG